MLIYVYLFIIILVMFLLVRFKRFNLLFSVIFTLIIIYFLLNPKVSIQSAKSGLVIFINSVFPTLFPFLVVCNMLIFYDGIVVYSKILGPFLCTPLRLSNQCSLALTISILCGYPLGAKYSTKLYEDGFIQEEEYARLLNIASNTGPLFIIGSVATSMFGNTYWGYLMLFANYISCFIMSLIISPSKSKSINIGNSKDTTYNFGSALKNSLEDATKTCINVAGFVIIFSVIISVLKNNYVFNSFILFLSSLLKVNTEILNSLFLGMTEITNGCYLLSTTKINIVMKLSLASFLCSFSGASIIAQVHSFTYKHSCFSMGKYFYRKLLQGIISFIITYFICTINLDTLSVFNNAMATSKIFILPFMILLILSLFIYTLRTLFDRS